MTLQVAAVSLSREVVKADNTSRFKIRLDQFTDKSKQMHKGIGKNSYFNICNILIMDAGKRNGPQRVARLVCSP